MGAEFINAWFPHAKNIIVPNPTWGNHIPIMKNAGLALEKYTYFDKQTNGLNIDGMLEDLHVSYSFFVFENKDLMFIYRKHPRTQLSCSMLVLTTPPVSILPRNNGIKSPRLWR